MTDKFRISDLYKDADGAISEPHLVQVLYKSGVPIAIDLPSFATEAMKQMQDALICAALDKAAEAVDTCDDSSVTEALGELLCCNGYQCGCRGAHLGSLLVHTILALKTKPEVLAAIKAKAGEGLG